LQTDPELHFLVAILDWTQRVDQHRIRIPDATHDVLMLAVPVAELLQVQDYQG